jgi:tetratricopeptide (TPR) repeat protein
MAHLLMAEIFHRQGDYQKAIEEGELAVSLAPSNAINHLVLGRIMHYAKRPNEAITLIKTAMRLSPYFPANYLLFLARAYHQAGNYEDAIAAYQQLLDRSQKGEAEPLRAHVGLVVAYLELGQEDKAKYHAAEVFQIEPNYPFFAVAKRNLLYSDLEHLERLLSPVTSQQVKATEKERFVHKGEPAFYFDYPKDSKNRPKQLESSVLSMRSPGRVAFDACVDVIPQDIPLSKIGPKHYASILNTLGSNVEVISNKELILKDGTEAFRTEIKWLYADGKTWLNTVLVSAFKEGKWIYITVHPIGNPADVAWIVESLTFE